MTGNRPTQDRATLPPGVTCEGEAGVYTALKHGRIIGNAWRAPKRHATWYAAPLGSRIRFSGPTMTAAVTAWLQEAT